MGGTTGWRYHDKLRHALIVLSKSMCTLASSSRTDCTKVAILLLAHWEAPPIGACSATFAANPCKESGIRNERLRRTYDLVYRSKLFLRMFNCPTHEGRASLGGYVFCHDKLVIQAHDSNDEALLHLLTSQPIRSPSHSTCQHCEQKRRPPPQRRMTRTSLRTNAEAARTRYS